MNFRARFTKLSFPRGLLYGRANLQKPLRTDFVTYNTGNHIYITGLFSTKGFGQKEKVSEMGKRTSDYVFPISAVGSPFLPYFFKRKLFSFGTPSS